MINSAVFDFLCYLPMLRHAANKTAAHPAHRYCSVGYGENFMIAEPVLASINTNRSYRTHIVSPLGAASHPPAEMQKLLCINSFTPPESPTKMCPSCCVLSSVGKPYASYAGTIPEGYAEANLARRKTPTQQDTLLILQQHHGCSPPSS